MLRPTLDVTLAANDLVWTMGALIDTGSPPTLFPRGAADALGFDLDDARSRPDTRTVSMLGRDWLTVPEFVDLTLPTFPGFSWAAEVLFFLDDWDMPFGVLGHEGFLDRWAVSFNAYENYFVIEPADQFDSRMPVDVFEAFQHEYDDDWTRPGH